MAKNRVFSHPMPDASVPRNGFDLSKRINMQLPFGAIIPCYAHQYLAGSNVRINMDSFFRTAAVNTAAFPRLKMETEFFCVPLRYLWSYWDNFKLGINDYNSNLGLDIRNLTPNITLSSVPYFDVFSHLWPLLDADTSKDDLGYDWKEGAKRLADMLGYGRFNPLMYAGISGHVQSMSMFKAAAYQKVYYDHFRNTAYESNDPFNYNLDDITQPNAPNMGTQAKLLRLFKLRYVNYRKDYFMSVYPGLNFIFGSGSFTSNFNTNTVPSWIQGMMSSSLVSEQVSSNNSAVGGGATTLRVATYNSGASYLSVQGLRAIFALDKLNRSAAYAPQHVKAQYEARYGIKFPAVSSYESQRIGSFETDIVIGEVTSTANTYVAGAGSGDQLGAIGGKGVGSARPNQSTLNFDVKEDSIIIGVCYAQPRQMYDSYRFDSWNIKLARNDFFMPEFMNLGLKPVYQKELAYGWNSSLNVAGALNWPIGYQLPYMEYKVDVDENHGMFADTGSDLGQFTVHTNLNAGSYLSTPGAQFMYFKVKPADMDSIFVNAYDGTESTDHLFGEITFKIACNQNMSVHGVPKL